MMSCPVVSAAWLFEHLPDSNVVVIDCRFSLTDPNWGQQQYASSHIPGAFYFDLDRDLSSPQQPHGGRHPLPDLHGLAQKLSAIGINSTPATTVVAYDSARFAFASRLWWLLRYLGHDSVVVLDGGFAAWQAAGYPLTDQLPQPQPGVFSPQVRSNWVVDREQIQTAGNRSEIALVDSREAVRYRGEVEPIDPVAGHIPGAVNYPWQEVTSTDGFLHPIDQQQQRWAPLQRKSELWVYCGSGVTACVNLLSLSVAGLSSGKLYAGSWSDWCSYSDASIAADRSVEEPGVETLD